MRFFYKTVPSTTVRIFHDDLMRSNVGGYVYAKRVQTRTRQQTKIHQQRRRNLKGLINIVIKVKMPAAAAVQVAYSYICPTRIVDAVFFGVSSHP